MIAAIEKEAAAGSLLVRTSFETGSVREGDSVSVDGVCLTATAVRGQTFSVDASLETLRLTTLKDKAPGQKVNSKGDGRRRPLRRSHRDWPRRHRGNHKDIRSEGDSIRMTIEVPPETARVS